jgi:exosortase E/protease (VPEID-CTERM system)
VGLAGRVAAVAALIGAEFVCATIAFDGDDLRGKAGHITALLARFGSPVSRSLVVFCALLAAFTWLLRKTEVAEFSGSAASISPRWPPLVVHLFAVAGFVLIGRSLYAAGQSTAAPDLLTLFLLAFASAAVVSAALAVLPWHRWKRALFLPGSLWLWSAAASILVAVTTDFARGMWLSATAFTFRLVRLLLLPFVPLTVLDPAHLRLGTRRFTVIISPECSGLEGVSLLLLFVGLWLILFRKECRFPQALLLLPVGAAIQFLLNAVRIAVLLLIGNSGARQIAAGGFHSQAGWIFFILVALGLCAAAGRIPWFTGSPAKSLSSPAVPDHAESPWTASYLLPFLSILAAGMLSHAWSGGFEWLYPLRVVAPLAVFWFYRRDYRQLFSQPRPNMLFPVAAGFLVFAIWIAFDSLSGAPAHAAIPLPLERAWTPLRLFWISFRVFSAVVTVPLAEELAFRGFLIRRLRARDFHLLPPVSYSWAGLLISSAAFGLLHGSRWPAGVCAGLIYAILFVRRGRLADPVIAHAVTNACLAAAVLFLGYWQYW